MSRCPGCKGERLAVLAEIPREALIDGYRKSGLVDDVVRLFTAEMRSVKLVHCQDCDLRWFADAPVGDAPFYESLQKHDWYYQSDKPEYAFAAAHVSEDAAVLEVGCGRGAFAPHLRARSYRGLEFNQEAVATARRAGLDVEIRDIEDEARSRPGVYDVVCHFQVLEHVPAPLEFMEACAATLRPGGLLIVAVPSEDSFLHLVEDDWLNMPPHHLTRWSDRALASLVRKVGVEPTETWHEPVAAYHVAWHRNVVVRAALRSLYGGRPRLRRSSGAAAAARVLSRASMVRDALFRHGMRRYPEAARGHTVCIVGRKL